MSTFAPAGYVQLSRPGAQIVVQEAYADALLQITSHGTVYDWAAEQPGKRTLQGRLPVYATTLPFDGPAVVVRRNHHGGLFAGLRKDRFFRSRGPFELFASLLLDRAGIPTPQVVAHATYRVNALERRIDVITRELPPGLDLGAALLHDANDVVRADRWRAVRELLRTLAWRGVWHQDLNVKNIYFIEENEAPAYAVLLDVDRVRFNEPGALVARANAARLLRSLKKWRVKGGAVTDADLSFIATAAQGA